MKKIEKFFKEFSKEIFDGGKDVDHPNCPQCGGKMKFYGHSGRGKNIVDFPLGEGYWECTSCSYSFTEDEVWPYYDNEI